MAAAGDQAHPPRAPDHVVYVTHDQEEALVLSDRIAVVNRGRVEQVGTAAELYERPRTLFVAEFVGESNTFSGRVGRSGDHVEIVADGYSVLVPAAAAAGLAEGARGVVVVRPERLRVAVDGQPVDGNVLDAVVRQIVYLGSARKLELELGDGQLIRARETAGALSPAGEGDRVRVSWAPDDGVLLSDQDANGAIDPARRAMEEMRGA